MEIDVVKGRIDLASAKHIYLNNDSQINAGNRGYQSHITPQMLERALQFMMPDADVFRSRKR